MKIIEALKELPLIEKKVKKNNEKIREYSSFGSHVGPAFDTQEQQNKEVDSLIQSNKDLIYRYMKIKHSLNLTNLKTDVTINGQTCTIADWIIWKQKTGQMFLSTYANLSTSIGESHIRIHQANLQDGIQIGIVKCYSETFKNTNIDSIQDTIDKIDAALEMVNATTDLIEEIN